MGAQLHSRGALPWGSRHSKRLITSRPYRQDTGQPKATEWSDVHETESNHLCVYPYIPFDEFFMNDGLYDMDLFRRGTPENNPDRKPYIADVYVDEAGKGCMVTVGAPVYRRDEFMGIVGFDLTLESLSQSMRLGPLAGDSVYLVNEQAQIIASAERKDVEEVLSLANAQVTTCGSAAEALRQFDAAPHGFNLVIADQAMPGGSGVDLIREIRKLNGDLPVFLHSGYPDAVNPQDVARYKIAKVLLKPRTADELTRAINAAVGL